MVIVAVALGAVRHESVGKLVLLLSECRELASIIVATTTNLVEAKGLCDLKSADCRRSLSELLLFVEYVSAYYSMNYHAGTLSSIL